MSDRELLKSTLERTAECFSPEQLEKFAGEQTPSHPHLSECLRCQAELALLKSFDAATPLPDEGAAVAWIGAHLERNLDTIKSPSRTRAPQRGMQTLRTQRSLFAAFLDMRGMRWAIPVTALAAIVIVGAIVLRSPKEPRLQANVGGQPGIYRSQEVQLVSPIGDIEQVPREFRWQAFEGAVVYKLALMEVDRSVFWSSESKANSVAVPVPVRAKILPGKPILWQVRALDAQGRVLATSQVQEFVSPKERSSKNSSIR